MTPRNLAVVLVVVWAIFSLLLSHAVEPDPELTALEYAPNMVRGPDLDAYAPTDVFGNGHLAQMPVPGTSARRGLMPWPFSGDDAGRAKAGRILKSPVDFTDPRVLERGQNVFASMCSACHGPGGAGDGLVTKRGVPPPPSLMAQPAKDLKDGEIFHIITFGRKNMPPHAGQISRMDRWNVIAWVRSLQEKKP